MTEQITSLESWQKPAAPRGGLCWNCKVGTYLVYASDPTKTSRCGQCGELEQDDPIRIPAKPKPAPQRRTAKPKEKA